MVISYKLVTSCFKNILKTMQFDCVICDEAHYLKNAKSQRSHACYQLSLQAERLILLTGTPGHKTCEMWNLLRMMDPRIFAQFYNARPPRNFTIPKPSQQFFYFADRYVDVQIVPVGRG